MNEGRGVKAKQITAQMLRFMYALNINQTSYIHIHTYINIQSYIHRYIKAYTHTYIYYLCRSVTKRIVCKSGTVADAERRTGMRMRGGRAHKFISCPIQALPFLDLAKCVDSLQTPTHTHAHTYIHTWIRMQIQSILIWATVDVLRAPPTPHTHTHTQTSLDKGVHKKSSGVPILCTHTRAHKPGLRRTM